MITGINMPSYIFAEIVGVLTVLMIAGAAFIPGINPNRKRYLIAYFSSIALEGLVFSFDMWTYMKPETLALSRWLPLIEYLLYPVPHIILTFYLFDYCEEKLKSNVLLRISVFLFVLYDIMVIIGHFTYFFYCTSPEGRFYRKPAHPLLLSPIIAILLIDLILLVSKRKRISKSHYILYLIYLVSSLIATTTHSFVFAIMVINITTWMSSTAMYVLIIRDHIEQYTRQQIAITNQNANILMLQMRPHFVYNTMTSIYYLCEQDPQKAQKAILDFTSYLRKNFNAIVNEDTIPFNEELEHVNAYLAVELVQFEDNLIIEYDTQHTQFNLPPLTMQPIIENAIKHGMDPDSDPLIIKIQTRQTKAGSLITITDNGPGFDSKDVFNSNNALSNIKQRLKIMCDGDIKITSQIGKGTVVTILIP